VITNTCKRTLDAGGSVIGIAAGLGSHLSAEAMAGWGFDFVMVDNQHGYWDDQSSALAFRSIVLGGSIPFIRVQKNDYYTIGRALDRGAMGIIVPMVNSAEEAAAAARAVRYPPRGGRSMGPFGTGFLGANYAAEINDQVYLAVQIEQKIAAERAEEILGVEGVDGMWLGPSDLGLSMGVDLNTEAGRREHEDTILGVIEACVKVGKVPGIAARPETARYWLDKGMRFVTMGAELTVMQPAALKALADARK
jgi:4-hydroxy-2-oxoheptanedioate aldolase